MPRTIHYSNESYNPDFYYVVSHFDKDGNCTKEYIQLSSSCIPGLTDEVITVIRDMNKEEHESNLVNDRYLVDPRYKASKTRHKDLEESEIVDSNIGL